MEITAEDISVKELDDIMYDKELKRLDLQITGLTDAGDIKNAYDNTKQLIKDYKIKNRSKISFGYSGSCKYNSILDHVNIFTVEGGGYIFVASPYDHVDKSLAIDELGMTEYKRIYGPQAYTFVKKLDSRKELNTFIKKLQSE